MVQLYNHTSAANKWQSTATVIDAQKLDFPEAAFSHTFLSFGLPIIPDPVRAATEMYRTLRPGGTAVTAFWLQIPQGECAAETRRSVYGADARLAVEPKPEHKDRDYIRSLPVQGGFRFEDVQLHEKSAFLPVQDFDEFALAIWSAIGVPVGGWTHNDEDTWDVAVAKYKELLPKKSGFNVDERGNITLEAIAQVAIVRKPRE
ncbi:hypothetical protein PG994_009955 [Apiospora phragmitis]|uniref:Methyltransferase type 11 domain-containing protein n=1 Tax=Apiospora phragmitis TaxID=2905665 RepID=A0ABR1TNI2_9PEZI